MGRLSLTIVDNGKTKGPPDLPSGLLRLLLLVSVQAKTLLALVGRHLMSLMLFSVGHML